MEKTLSLTRLEEELETRSGLKLRIRLNNNYSTMLSVRRDNKKEARVSLHRMFLDAPRNVVLALASFIRGSRKKTTTGPVIRAFIEEKISCLDYTDRLDRQKLTVVGRYHDLEELYQQVNEEYFHSSLNLNITWFGKEALKPTRSITYGLYLETLKLIKIHRRLDRPEVPSYVIAFVIYHEMLHHVCSPQMNHLGRLQVHTEEFKRREKEFRQYREAQRWIDQHRR